MASLSDNNVTAIEEDLEGNLWVATQNGLNRFKPNTQTFARYLHNPDDPESISSNDLHHLYLDHNGVLWIGTNNGLDIYNAQLDHFIHYRHESSNPGSLSNNIILNIFEDRGGIDVFDFVFRESWDGEGEQGGEKEGEAVHGVGQRLEVRC